MDKELINRIKELKEAINKLPKGYISAKNIGGNVYYYHQWNESGKKNSKYISTDELLELDSLIKQRQILEEELKALKKGYVSKYTLTHRNEKVIDLYFDNNAHIKGVGTIYDSNHLPIGSLDEKGNINNNNIIEWWNERSIPLSRSGAREVFEKLESTNYELLIKCLGLSLSDQYWIKPTNKDMSWEDINFFNNEFSEDIGELLLGNEIKNKDLDLSSPDNTSVGNLKKRWKIIDSKRMMFKGGSNPFRQEPYNEVVASLILDALGIDHVNYSLTYIDNYPYSICEDFVKDDEDLVTAYLINKALKKNNSDSNYTHLLKCADYLKIPNFKEFLDKLIVFDFIIANEDRHFNNFGAIRNAKTLEFVRPAPVYDSGASFGFDKIDQDIKPFKNIEAKPFNKDIIEQLKLANSFSWLNIDKLEYIKSHIYEWFIKYESVYLSENRIKAIADSLIERINYLLNYCHQK